MATAVSKKSSPTADVVFGQSSKKLALAVKELAGVSQQLTLLTDKSDDLSAEIAGKEEKIKALDVEYAEKRRAHDVEFDLKVKEDNLKVVEGILGSQQLVAVPKQELEDLKKGLTDLQTSFDDKVRAEVGKAVGIEKSRFESEKRLLEAQFQTKEAENTASIKSLSAQVSELKTLNEVWKEQLDSERKASVERAKAAQIGALNIGSQGTGR